MIEQFSLYNYSSVLVVVLNNTIFNEVESILVAPVKLKSNEQLIQHLQIPCTLDDKLHFIDLLDIATVSKRGLKAIEGFHLRFKRDEIKSGIDLLIDGF
uniref:CcdB family protein n=1 Tax=Ningiella ruwaisensis TaxID=2364274 RepID=UPI00109F157C|nr:CcdB family protein [Ningiella ruwaisensis]